MDEKVRKQIADAKNEFQLEVMKRATLKLASLLIFIEAMPINTRPAKPLYLTKKDKMQIIESVLWKESVRDEFAKADKVYVLQNEIFMPEFIPEDFKNRVILIKPEELKEKEESLQGIVIFSFSEFQINLPKVMVKFGFNLISRNSWYSKVTFYEYQKQANFWRGNAIEEETMISNDKLDKKQNIS